MKARKSIILLLAILLACISAPAAPRPNIILVMLDDMGYEWLSCYGSESVQTPELDALAANGVRFNHCYSTPLCTPSRVEIMTGRYSYRNYTGFGNYPDGETTFANILHDAGYTTCAAGKWQLTVDPADAGFDQYCLWRTKQEEKVDKIKYPKGGDGRYWIPKLMKNGEWVPGTDTDYGPDTCTDFVCGFVAENKDRPFLVYYPMMLTHSPFLPTPLDIARDAPIAERTKQDDRNFPGMVRYVDKLMGRIKSAVAKSGLTDNTLILFMSDNGTGHSIVASLNGREYEGGKGRLIDNGTRVPLIASWLGGGGKKGAVSDELIDLTDFLPTVAEAAGVKLPNPGRIDGISFLPMLRNTALSRRDWAMTYFVDHRDSYPLGYWIRNQRWKLYNDGRLFDMQNDPTESQPVDSPEQDAIRKKLENVFREQNVTDDMLNQYLIKQGNVPVSKKKPAALPVI